MKKKTILAVCALAGVLAAIWLGHRHAARTWPITNATPSGSVILAFGDSLTAGQGAPPGEGYPEQLARRIGREVLNQGVNGNTTADALARLERDVIAHDPRIVIVLLGGNDILRKIPREQTFRNLEAIITRIQARGALVILVGMKGSALLGVDYRKDYEDLARRTGCPLVPNIQQGVFGSPDLMADQIHPNARGYAKFAERIAATLEHYL